MTKVPDLKFEPDWRRLKFVIDQSGLSEQGFAEFVELPDPSIVTHIRYAQCGIDEQLALRINRKYPEYSVEWLMGRSEAKAPEVGALFRQVRTAERIKGLIYGEARRGLEEQADYVSKLIVRAVPLEGPQRAYLLGQLAGGVEELFSLYEIMKECVLPEHLAELHLLCDRCDELYEAAEKLGVVSGDGAADRRTARVR